MVSGKFDTWLDTVHQPGGLASLIARSWERPHRQNTPAGLVRYLEHLGGSAPERLDRIHLHVVCASVNRDGIAVLERLCGRRSDVDALDIWVLRAPASDQEA